MTKSAFTMGAAALVGLFLLPSEIVISPAQACCQEFGRAAPLVYRAPSGPSIVVRPPAVHTPVRPRNVYTWRPPLRWPGTGTPPTQPPFAPTPVGFPGVADGPDGGVVYPGPVAPGGLDHGTPGVTDGSVAEIGSATSDSAQAFEFEYPMFMARINLFSRLLELSRERQATEADAKDDPTGHMPVAGDLQKIVVLDSSSSLDDSSETPDGGQGPGASDNGGTPEGDDTGTSGGPTVTPSGTPALNQAVFYMFPLITNDQDEEKSACDIVPDYDFTPLPGDPDYCEDHMPVAKDLQKIVVLVPGS